MTDKKDTDKPLAKEAAAPKDTAKKASAVSTKKAAAKKEPAATVAKSAATKDTVSKVSAGAATKVTVNKAATAATAKAAASKESDMKHAAQKISEIDKTAANNSIKSRKSVEDLKARAHEAKQRAQKKYWRRLMLAISRAIRSNAWPIPLTAVPGAGRWWFIHQCLLLYY